MKLGIIGAGKIVQEQLTFLNDIEGIELVAIAATARSEEKLKGLCSSCHIARYYTDYEKLLADDEVEVVYVALPNNLHYEVMDKALDYGKDIICEKPFTANIDQALKIFRKAEKKNLIVLEAMSNRFNPNALAVKERIKDLGKIKIVSFNYSQYSSRYDAFKKGEVAPAFSLGSAGGALMDLNVYNIDYVINLFGPPDDVKYFPNIENSIDTSGVMVMDYGDFKAVCIGAKDSSAAFMNTIQGDLGTITIKDALNSFNQALISIKGQDDDLIKLDESKSRLFYEWIEFDKILKDRDYKKADDLADLTLATSEAINQARIEAGIFFPSDEN